MAGARNPEPPPATNNNMVSCQLCAKPFGKPTKLQRHLLQAHPVDVTIARDEVRDNAASSPGGGGSGGGSGDPPPLLNEDQRRADEGVQAALAAANLAMQIGNTGSGVECPQCLPDNRGRLFKNAIDLASHMISKHNIIPSDDDDDSDEEEEQEERKNRASGLVKAATDLNPAEIGLRERLVTADARTGGACHRFLATTAGAGPSAPASEVSEKLTDSRKRGLSIDASAQAGNEAKRTKLLCVDVSNDGAKAPAPRDIPSPALAIVPKPEITICNLEQDTLVVNPNKGSPANEAPKDAAPSAPPFELGVSAAKKEPTPVAADTRREPPVSLARSRSPPALETDEGTKVSDSHRESVLSAVDAVARDILAANQKSAGPGKRASQSTRPAEIQPTLIPVSGNPLASRAQFMTKGFDMDFTDICDFPSSVHPAYYRQAAVVENGDSKP
jgi:hypothetical protein